MKSLIVFLSACLTACTHTQSSEPAQTGPLNLTQTVPLNLSEMSSEDAPYWDLVSFTGMDDAFRTAYDAKSFTWSTGDIIPVETFDLGFEEFKKISGRIRIFSHNEQVFLSYSSCNGISARYETGPTGSLVFKSAGSTGMACEYTPISPSGKPVILPNPMYADNWFEGVARKVVSYEVSDDRQTLTLHNNNDDVLAVFSYRGALL